MTQTVLGFSASDSRAEAVIVRPLRESWGFSVSQTDLAGEGNRDSQLDPRRWRALLFIAIAQLMVVLDATIVNIALPSVQADLGISDGNRQWVVTAYALAFGGLLLLGGRIADTWGRKRTFVTGLVGFAAASALGGAAANEAMLFASRALQGAFGAVLAPVSRDSRNCPGAVMKPAR